MKLINDKLEYTLKEELKVYERAYEIHKSDVYHSRKYNGNLSGMCSNIIQVLLDMNLYPIAIKHIKCFPRFMKLQPSDKLLSDFWWSTDANDTNRLRNYEQLIKEVKQEIEHYKNNK